MAIESNNPVRVNAAAPVRQAQGTAPIENQAQEADATARLQNDANQAGRARGLTGPLAAEVNLDAINFDRIDINDDGYLSGVEVGDLKKYDADKNGRITREEYNKGVNEARWAKRDEAAFKGRDITEDGWLSGTETRGIEHYDKDGDGEITKAEFMAGRKADRAGGGNDKPLDEAGALAYLQKNFQQVAGGDGQISREDLEKNLPDGPGKQALLKNFDALIFANIDAGRQAWRNLSMADVAKLVEGAKGGGIDRYAAGLVDRVAKQRGIGDITRDGKIDYADLKKYVDSYGTVRGPQPRPNPQGGGDLDTRALDNRVRQLEDRLRDLDNRLARADDPREMQKLQAEKHLVRGQIEAVKGVGAAIREAAAQLGEGEQAMRQRDQLRNLMNRAANANDPGELTKLRYEAKAIGIMAKNPGLDHLTTEVQMIADASARSHHQIRALMDRMAHADDPREIQMLQVRLVEAQQQHDDIAKAGDLLFDALAKAGNGPDARRMQHEMRDVFTRLSRSDNPSERRRAMTRLQELAAIASNPGAQPLNATRAVSQALESKERQLSDLMTRVTRTDDPRELQFLQAQMNVLTAQVADLRRGVNLTTEALAHLKDDPAGRAARSRIDNLGARLAQANDPREIMRLMSQLEREVTAVRNPNYRPLPAQDAIVDRRAALRAEQDQLVRQLRETDDPRQLQRLQARMQELQRLDASFERVENLLHREGRQLSDDPTELLAWGRLNELVLQYLGAADSRNGSRILGQIEGLARQIR